MYQKRNKLIFILVVFNTLLLSFSFGQSINTNEIKICNKTVSFSSSLTINQKRQTIKSATFEMMYVYIKHVTDMEGFYFSTGTNGKRSYITNYSTDMIIKQGLTNNPFKEYEITYTPTEFIVLEKLFKGSVIEKKEKGTETISHYLIACGKICGEDIGFEVKLNNKQVDNNSLSNELKKILMFKEK